MSLIERVPLKVSFAVSNPLAAASEASET